jgi:hypothetical protein
MNMPRRIVALSSVHHADLRVRTEADPEHLRGLHMAALMQSEMVRASALYPIVFLEDADADLFRPMALLGLREGENAFVDPEGQWRASYIPAVVRGHPFSLVGIGTDDRHALCVDLDSPCVSRESGTPLFNQDGQPTPALEEARAYFARLRQMQVATDAYTRALVRLNLLSPFTLRAQRQGHPVELAGCFVVDASRLEGLSDGSLAALRPGGWLAATYAHLASLHQIERLE